MDDEKVTGWAPAGAGNSLLGSLWCGEAAGRAPAAPGAASFPTGHFPGLLPRSSGVFFHSDGEEFSPALGMPNHSSPQTFGWECKDVYPAAVIRAVSGTEILSRGKVNTFLAFWVVGESSEMGQKKGFNLFNFYPKSETWQLKPVTENQWSLLQKHSQRAWWKDPHKLWLPHLSRFLGFQQKIPPPLSWTQKISVHSVGSISKPFPKTPPSSEIQSVPNLIPFAYWPVNITENEMPSAQVWWGLERGRLVCAQGTARAAEHGREQSWSTAGSLAEVTSKSSRTNITQQLLWRELSHSEQLWVFITTDKQTATPSALWQLLPKRDVMHKNLPPKAFNALHWEQIQVVPSHPLENSHSSDVCCCRMAQWVLCHETSKILIPSSCWGRVARCRTWDQVRQAQSQLSLPTPACKSQILYQGTSSLTFLGLSQGWSFSAHTVFWVLHSCTVTSHRSKDFPVALKSVKESVLPSILSQTEPGTDT